MRTTKTRTVAAVPAVPEREVEYEVVHCDVCGVDVTERYTICEVCKRELCWKCYRCFEFTSGTLSHYPAICSLCYALWGTAYREKLTGIKTTADAAEAEALREWAAESLAAKPVDAGEEE